MFIFTVWTKNFNNAGHVHVNKLIGIFNEVKYCKTVNRTEWTYLYLFMYKVN